MELSICLYLSKLSPTLIKSRKIGVTNYQDMFTVSCQRLHCLSTKHQLNGQWCVMLAVGKVRAGPVVIGLAWLDMSWTDTSYNERSMITLGLVTGHHQASKSGHDTWALLDIGIEINL